LQSFIGANSWHAELIGYSKNKNCHRNKTVLPEMRLL